MKDINLNEINIILSDTLKRVISKEISLKQAGAIARIAGVLSKNIVNTELKDRVEFLEQALKSKR
jgi:hypothetical protein